MRYQWGCLKAFGKKSIEKFTRKGRSLGILRISLIIEVSK